MIKHEDGKWKRYTEDGLRLLSVHNTEEEAIDQEATIKANNQSPAGKRIDLVKRFPHHVHR